MVIYYILMMLFFLPANFIEKFFNYTLRFLDRVATQATQNSDISEEEMHRIGDDVNQIRMIVLQARRSFGTNTINMPKNMTRRELLQIAKPVEDMVKKSVKGINKAMPEDVVALLAVSALYALYRVTMEISKVCYRPSGWKNIFANLIPLFPDLRDKLCSDSKAAWSQTLVVIKGILYLIAAKMAAQYVLLFTPALLRAGFTQAEIRGFTGVNTRRRLEMQEEEAAPQTASGGRQGRGAGPQPMSTGGRAGGGRARGGAPTPVVENI